MGLLIIEQKNINEILDKKWIGGLFHLYNTTDTWNQWLDEFEKFYEWPADLAEKFQKVIVKNYQYIKDRRVADLACNLGYFTLGCSAIGARSVIGLEVRQPYLDVFNRVQKHSPYTNTHVINVNIENINELIRNLIGIETILYSGHFYHTSNNFDIISALTNSQANCIIIESISAQNSHGTESTLDELNGYIDENTTCIDIYAPTLEETVEMFKNLQWKVKHIDTIDSYDIPRFVITAVRGD